MVCSTRIKNRNFPFHFFVKFFGQIFRFYFLGYFRGKVKMSEYTGNFLIKILAWGHECHKIKSCRTSVDRSLFINVISYMFANYLDCRIEPIENCLALVKGEPVLLVGRTCILVRLPKKRLWRGKFQKVTCEVAVRPKHDLIIDKATQTSLRTPQPYSPP